MHDKELADAVVALGVGACNSMNEEIYQPPSDVIGIAYTAEQFVTDWRVAGALMEKCDDVRCLHNVMRELSFEEHAHHPLPRAIVLACLEALESE